MMKVYFGILKEGVSQKEAEKFLEKLNLKMIKFYPALNIVQFQSEQEIKSEISIFKIVELEKNNFRGDHHQS